MQLLVRPAGRPDAAEYWARHRFRIGLYEGASPSQVTCQVTTRHVTVSGRKPYSSSSGLDTACYLEDVA